MEFDFLPKLPKPDLDDRTFQDLVEECKLRIPRYCPEWTNYNPSDPGITLIELFAWLTDQMLLRFNQVPRRNYVTFLELLGVRLQPPTPAQTALTFYLSASLDNAYSIPAGTEVATVRTETEQAVVFSTDKNLVVGQPSIKHLLTAAEAETEPQILRDRFSGIWRLGANEEWEGPELSLFNEQPEEGNCFYLVFDPEEPIAGNVISVTFKGEAATSTGINPEQPPRRWEAWNGAFWEPILLREEDDSTEGFSFAQLTREGGDPFDGTDIIFHTPQSWPVTQFVTYQGRWLRCVYGKKHDRQPGYLSSPRIVGLSSRSLGGTIGATQSTLVRDEILGESDGQPGQTFQLKETPILPRNEDEHIMVSPPVGLPQKWQEVPDFAESTAGDLHYTLDSTTGLVQFGPLIREPAQLQTVTRWREQLQSSRTGPSEEMEQFEVTPDIEQMERQYGAVPPRGSTIRMVAYRTGGGLRGNVQSSTITVIKSAVPYVARVTNYKPARNGSDAESLENAVIRVPKLLRTRDRAVTAEDFETLAQAAGRGAIARARCIPSLSQDDAGIVRLVLVPQANLDGIQRREGIHPDWFNLNPNIVEQVISYLDERRLLGVEVRCHQAEYVGAAVQTEVALEPEYNNPQAQQEILNQLQIALYRFLNPLTGGPEGTGWPFGRQVYSSDIVNLFQIIPGVRYLGTVQLFEIRHDGRNWVRRLPKEPVIDPGPLGLICSWYDHQLRSGHVINLI